MAGSLKARINGELRVVGRPGPPGNPGTPGSSAYQIAVANGFVGTETEWLASLEGVDGADGVVASIVAGDNITVDDTDPANPIISASGGGGGGGAVLLAAADLDSTSQASLSSTSTTHVDVDAALACTFTVPASGAVRVVLSARCVVSGTGNDMLWLLRDGSTYVPNSTRNMLGTNGSPARPHYDVRFTGLTPGASLTWKWAWRLWSSGTMFLAYGGVDGGQQHGPATMRVWSA